MTGRTHQIRVHLAESGCPIVSDELYGRQTGQLEFGLRAVRLAYKDPFTRKPVEINAPVKYFLKDYGFDFKKYFTTNEPPAGGVEKKSDQLPKSEGK